MDDPWFGKKGNGYTGGPVNLKGWAALLLCIGGGYASHFWLPSPYDWLGVGACAAVLGYLFLTRYDPDTESW